MQQPSSTPPFRPFLFGAYPFPSFTVTFLALFHCHLVCLSLLLLHVLHNLLGYLQSFGFLCLFVSRRRLGSTRLWSSPVSPPPFLFAVGCGCGCCFAVIRCSCFWLLCWCSVVVEMAVCFPVVFYCLYVFCLLFVLFCCYLFVLFYLISDCGDFRP